MSAKGSNDGKGYAQKHVHGNGVAVMTSVGKGFPWRAASPGGKTKLTISQSSEMKHPDLIQQLSTAWQLEAD